VTPDLRRHFGAPDGVGVLVTGIAAGRPAAVDGFRAGDVLVRLGGQPVSEAKDVERLLLIRRDEAIAASLIRARREEVVTVHGSHIPVSADGTGDARAKRIESLVLRAADEEDSAARAALDRAVRLEIERLEKRIERLKRELESLEAESD
jgi:membrane-associated protease RseP (regulator of RpoE activity)